MKQKIFEHLSRDPRMAPILPLITLPEIEVHNDIYTDLLGSIVSQQLSVKAAATIEGRFLDLFPDRKPLPELVVEMAPETMRAVGLSGQKASYIRNVAAYWIEKQRDMEDWMAMSDDYFVTGSTTAESLQTNRHH